LTNGLKTSLNDAHLIGLSIKI